PGDRIGAGHGRRYGRGLVGIQDAVIIVVDVDRPAAETRLTRFAGRAVSIQVLELHALLGGRGPVAEVVASLDRVRSERLLVVVERWEGVGPAGLRDFLDLPGTRRDAGHRVGAGHG